MILNLSEKLFLMEPVEVYKLLLSGEIKRFPKNYFKDSEQIHMDRCIDIIKYFIEEELKYSDKDICEKLNREKFKENGLYGMLDIVFNRNIYDAINAAYPNKFKPWQLISVSHGYWNKDTAAQATKWLIKEKLKWSNEDVCKNLNREKFKENGLYGMLLTVFDGSLYEAINAAYPNKFKPWQLMSVPHGYWNKDTGIQAVRWLIEEELKYSDKDICKKLNCEKFKENGLYGMLRIVFDGSLYEAINAAYPNKFKPWQITSVSNGYWNKDTAAQAVKWLIEEKLKWNDNQICENIKIKTFRENGLGGMLDIVFKNNKYEAINTVYPGKFVKIARKIYLA